MIKTMFSRVGVVGSLFVAATAIAGCAADAGREPAPTSDVPAPPAPTGHEAAKSDLHTSAVKAQATCTMSCFGWECYNQCEMPDGNLCVSVIQWQGGGWGSWSGYSCSQN